MLSDARMVYLFVYVSDLAASRAFYADRLGLKVIEEDDGCVKFDAGHVILALNRAADHPRYAISMPKGKDGSADIVFLVDDVRAMHAALRERGVQFQPVDWYQPGGIADFYDPDGHWLTLYQPSAEAWTWPSGERLRSVVDLRRDPARRPADALSPPDAPVDPALVRRGLDGAELIYLFFFVRDAIEAEALYHGDLGLQALEGGPCSRTSGGDEVGVVKYDTGGIIFATHHVEPQRTEAEVEEHLCPPRELVEGRLKSVAPVFAVRDVASAARTLAERRPELRVERTESPAGGIVSLEDPSGHLLFLYEPSAAALEWPSGARLRAILGTDFTSRGCVAASEAAVSGAVPAVRDGVPAD